MSGKAWQAQTYLNNQICYQQTSRHDKLSALRGRWWNSFATMKFGPGRLCAGH